MIGNARNVGLRVMPDPEKTTIAMTASVAIDMTTGSNRPSTPGDDAVANSGGAAMQISALPTDGGGRRVAGTNP